MILLVVIWFYFSGVGLAQNQNGTSEIPIRFPTPITKLSGSSQSECFSEADLQDVREKIKDLLNSHNQSCGGSTGWTRVVYLNMSDPSQQCPLNWTLINNYTVRGCGRLQTGYPTCDSVIYPVNRMYSSVCGRIAAYQNGTSTAFARAIQAYDRIYFNNIESPYVSGVSLTHGMPGSRQHIWTFVGAGFEQGRNFPHSSVTCSCTNTSYTWPHQVPTFIGNDYFCETGNRGPGIRIHHLYQDDPLWDGKGCGPTSTCCEFNHPPWMLKTLPYSTSDDLELRLCCGDPAYREDKIITLIEMYVK